MPGIYLINKPAGITSHDLVDYLRKITGEKTIGHAGTLDPLASGLMIVAIGREFTRKISEFSKLDKEYITEATLGATSTTYDAEGIITPARHSGLDPESRQENKQKKILNPILHSPSYGGLAQVQDDAGDQKDFSREEIKKTLQSFVGAYNQMPPIFSAKKVGGRKAYDLARQGKVVALKPVPVSVYEVKLLDYKYPILKFRAKVSSGTYIRSLVNDIGQKLGVGAYMSGLMRVAVGGYNLSQAIDLHQIKSVADLYPHPSIRGAGQLPLI